ncbi:MAG: hypothetical protein R6W99_09650 [Clostridia bacterium]
MFLENIGVERKDLKILAIATALLIAALVLIIIFMSGMNDKPTDLSFLGYGFTANESDVIVKTPYDGSITVEINDETYHELEVLSQTINSAAAKWQSILRNSAIFTYIAVFFIVLRKKRYSYAHGFFKGFLLGSGILLLLFTLQGALELNSLLISFSHHLSHMVF